MYYDFFGVQKGKEQKDKMVALETYPPWFVG